jgi:linoleate 10R-lipoxygenase
MDTVWIQAQNLATIADVSPDQTVQDSVRDKASGRGYLYPDTFAEERLFFFPPAPSVLLVIFCRNHNYICDMLLKINERKTWCDPVPTDAKLLAKQDEEIFQTARLVKCVSVSSVSGIINNDP